MSKLLLGLGALIAGSLMVEVALPSLLPPPEATAATGGMPSIAGIGQAGSPFGASCAPVVTQPYGPTSLVGEPFLNGTVFHTGIDLACPLGTPVRSLTAGVAHVTSGWSPAPCCIGIGGGFGNNVVVAVDMRLGDDVQPQRYFVRYAHLLGDVAVTEGQVVRPGDLLGFEGSTGFATGPHVHFEVDRGAPRVENSIDPSVLLGVVPVMRWPAAAGTAETSSGRSRPRTAPVRDVLADVPEADFANSTRPAVLDGQRHLSDKLIRFLRGGPTDD